MSQIRARLKIAWNFSTYTDESSYLVEASGEMRFSPLEDSITGGKGIVDTMSITLRNTTARFSALNETGPLYTYLQNGKAYHAPVTLEISINGGTNYYKVFTGVIKTPQEAGVTGTQAGIVTIECRSKDELLMNRRISTPLVDFRSYHDGGYNESQIISAWLTAAGVSAGDKLLDDGLQAIDWAWLDDESALEDIWSMAAACGGRFYADPDGKFVYENSAHWLRSSRSTTVQEAINETVANRITPVYDDSDLYNIVTVEASPRGLASADLLWEPDEIVSVPANSSKTLVAQLRQPAYAINAVEFAAATSGGQAITSSVSISSTYYAQRVEMTITNSHATHAAYLRPLRITGHSVTGSPSLEETRNSTDHGSNATFFTDRGNRSKSVRGNIYIQSRAQAGALAEFLLHRYEYPRLSYKIDGALGDPERRLGDRITVQDSRSMTNYREALIMAVSWSYGRDGYTHDIEAIDAAQLYRYQASPGYFLIGTDSLGSTKKVFY